MEASTTSKNQFQTINSNPNTIFININIIT